MLRSPWTIWLTGLPGSGKSTIATAACRQFSNCTCIDSDEARKVITPSPTYSESERDMVYRSIVFSAISLNRAQINVIVAATANKRNYRDIARLALRNYYEIYIHCPIDLCAARDPKGLYAAA